MSQTTLAPPVAGDDQHISRLVFVSFLITCLVSRLVVLLITLRWIPSLYLYIRGTHVHHLNYGIFLLSLVGAYLLFKRPQGTGRTLAAIAYGAGLALTFDEFGMWIHLGGSYWQRTSFNAVALIGMVLGIVVYAPAIRRIRPRFWISAVALMLIVGVFLLVLVKPLRQYAADHIHPPLRQIEAMSP